MPPLNPFTRSCVALAVSQTMLIPTSNAATINVISNADNNSSDGCTLRQAVVSINSASLQAGCTIGSGTFGIDDTINLNLTPSNNTITLNSDAGGQLQVNQGKSVTINGATGANVTIDGGGENRVFYLRGSSLSIDNLTITGGSENDGDGGGIYARSSSINLRNSRVSENSSGFSGGGIAARTSSSVSLNNSTVSGNSATFGGGISADSDSNIVLNNSAVSGNSAIFIGGGISAGFSNVDLNNSTVSGNSASFGGGINVGYTGNVSLRNSTVSSNSANSVGGIFSDYAVSITLSNTLVVGNQNTEIRVASNLVVSNGGNLLGDNSSTNADAFVGFIPGPDDILATSDGTQPTALLSILSPLADNGGPTLTHALPTGSPALAAAKGANCPEADQRGEPRESRDNSAFYVIKAANQKVIAFELGDEGECDIGSFER